MRCGAPVPTLRAAIISMHWAARAAPTAASVRMSARRFDRQVLVDRPDRKGRLDILKVHMRKIAGGSLRGAHLMCTSPQAALPRARTALRCLNRHGAQRRTVSPRCPKEFV
jgi:hypothetical protein